MLGKLNPQAGGGQPAPVPGPTKKQWPNKPGPQDCNAGITPGYSREEDDRHWAGGATRQDPEVTYKPGPNWLPGSVPPQEDDDDPETKEEARAARRQQDSAFQAKLDAMRETILDALRAEFGEPLEAMARIVLETRGGR